MNIEHRLALYYAATFACIGSIGPFVALWLDHRQISAPLIGVIVAAPSVAMIMTTVPLGRWADRLADRRRALIVGNWLVLLMLASLLVVDGPMWILLVWLMAGIITYALVPIVDAATLGVTQARGIEFGRIRVFGSVGFVLAILAAGSVYEQLGIAWFLVVLLVGAGLRLAAAHTLPALNNPDLPENDSTRFYTSLYQAGVLLTVAGAALIHGSHASFYTFGILLWTQAGLSEWHSSVLWSTGVVAEILVMWYFRALANRFSARHCLLLAGGAGVVRWLVTSYTSELLPLLFAQTLHALTFGILYLSLANFMARRVPSGQGARAQSLSATALTATMAAFTFISGLLFEALGSFLYVGMATLCALGMILVVASYFTILADSELPKSL